MTKDETIEDCPKCEKRSLVCTRDFSCHEIIKKCTKCGYSNEYQIDPEAIVNVLAKTLYSVNKGLLKFPEINLDNYDFYAFPESVFFSYNKLNERIKYQSELPSGTRNVGECTFWSNKTGCKFSIDFMNFDSNMGLKDAITAFKRTDEVIDTGNLKIGDFCKYFETNHKTQINLSLTELFFIYNTYFVVVIVLYEQGKSKNEAIRIAKLVESRIV